ncbi:MAG: galactose mutarotase [Ruminococcaceae bacterium]|nr:galactose mutarotase [Oscillospiraceae bacterium]
MEKNFGKLADGRQARLYTIAAGRVRAEVTDYGASLVSLFVDGVDVCLGCEDVRGYERNGSYLGAVVGRSANRIGGASFVLSGETVTLPANEGKNNLHSGPDSWGWRLWEKTAHRENSLTLSLHSPHGDQGFPGNADVTVTYTIENDGLTIEYRAVSDRDTVFNLTNHAYFNLFGQDRPEKAMEQELMIPGEYFCPDDAENIPTGELRHVDGTPFDFRAFKPIGRDIGMDYEPLILQGGYDHNFVNKDALCAVLRNPENGLTMTVTTDCPGVQVYAGNFLDNVGKGGVYYGKRTGVALETQFYPNCVNHPEWPQPVVKAGEQYRSVTVYSFR